MVLPVAAWPPASASAFLFHPGRAASTPSAKHPRRLPQQNTKTTTGHEWIGRSLEAKRFDLNNNRSRLRQFPPRFGSCCLGSDRIGSAPEEEERRRVGFGAGLACRRAAAHAHVPHEALATQAPPRRGPRRGRGRGRGARPPPPEAPPLGAAAAAAAAGRRCGGGSRAAAAGGYSRRRGCVGVGRPRGGGGAQGARCGGGHDAAGGGLPGAPRARHLRVGPRGARRRRLRPDPRRRAHQPRVRRRVRAPRPEPPRGGPLRAVLEPQRRQLRRAPPRRLLRRLWRAAASWLPGQVPLAPLPQGGPAWARRPVPGHLGGSGARSCPKTTGR